MTQLLSRMYSPACACFGSFGVFLSSGARDNGEIVDLAFSSEPEILRRL